ncbi:T9SS type A sorting domain-containing protein [Polluticoccus soli]|uniref:T9SS type A sorting domain-containing protein n=1 Tax=Polluticoccus soli TaxID=3034150 RepID=UPI0023E2ED6D|nr:T9SS type A sorting domain-containing protein [Flavipsychrobacter sp. JY13-12]
MRNLYLFLLAALSCSLNTIAQTTINTTVGSSGYTGTNSSGTNSFVTFVVENNSGGGIILTAVGNWTTTSHNNTTSTLWYSSTSLSGSPGTLGTPTWTQVASNVVSGITSTGVNPVITGMSFLIPNNAVYRFALNTTGTNYYSGSGSSCPSPTSFTSNSVALRVCNEQISGMNIGYGGSNSPRAFTGSITFMPACTSVASVTASNVTATAATLSWPTVSGSQGYEYALTTSATPPTAGTSTTGTNYNASGLTQSTTYYMHVRNSCSSTSFSGWTTTSFTTLTSCFPVTAVSVSNLTASAGVLSWSPGASTTGYEWVINQASGNPAGNGAATATTSTSFSGLTSGATYWAHVRNVCGGGDKSSWNHFQFTMPVCNKPTNMLISNVSDSSADLLWSQMPSANGYDYAVNFSILPPTIGIQTTTNIAAHLDDLVPNSKYYVHVRSKCFASDASDWRLDSFITKMVCYAPIVQVNNLGTNVPYAFWDAVPTAVAYEYALKNTSQEPAFGTTVYTTYTELELPADGKDYYLHVRSKCNSMFTFSPWSTVALRTGMTSISAVGKQHAEIYPNPVSDWLFIKNAQPGTVYAVIDMAGRVLIDGVITQNVQQIDASRLSSGVYLLKLNDEGSTQSRFVKQ